MIQAKKRLGLFALCATAVLASTSLLVSAAQAAPPNWDVGGAELGAGAKKALKGQLVGENNLLSNVLNKMIRISCTEMTPKIEIVAGGTVIFTAEFKKCTTYYGNATNDIHTTPIVALPELGACKPKEPIEAGGSGELVLHEGKDLVKLTGTPFVKVDVGPECAAGQEFEVQGTVFVEDVGGNAEFLKEQTIHRIQEAVTATLVLGGLKFGANPAAIDGQADVSLVSNENWRGLPG